MPKIIAYIRGGLGDIYPTVCVIKNLMKKYNISKFETIIFTDSLYYFRNNYPKKLETYSLDMIHKVTPNVIEISPTINSNFYLTINDTSDELSQENADKHLREFMFWRHAPLKQYIASFLNYDTIFIDSLFTNCIMRWDMQEQKYERIEDYDILDYNPPQIEKLVIDGFLKNKHLLINVRIRQESNQAKFDCEYYNKIIAFCNENGILPILIGIDMVKLKGKGIMDLREGNISNNMLSFESMGYLITQANVMVGDGNGMSLIKTYAQQMDKLNIVNVSRMRTGNWFDRGVVGKSNMILMDGTKEDNSNKIIKLIKDYYKI